MSVQSWHLLAQKPESRPASSAAVVIAFTVLLADMLGCGAGVVANSPQQDAAAPIASANGPQLGYMWMNADQTLRPILGLPGASQIGQSVVPAGVYLNAVTSASASVAVLQGADGSFDVMRLPSGSPASVGLTLPPGARMRLSPSGTSALLYTPGATSASLVTGLRSVPNLQTVTAAAPITGSAVSDSGAAGLEYAQGPSLAVAVTPLGGRSTPVATVRAAGGISFVPGRDDLVFADAAANTLTLIRNASTAPSIQPIPAAGFLNTPSSVGVSNSGRWAVVANSGSQSLVRVDLATFVSVSVPCSCKPTLAEALADDGAFRVTELASAPNWLIDASTANPRMMFIPASRISSGTAVIASAVQP